MEKKKKTSGENKKERERTRETSDRRKQGPDRYHRINH